MARIEESAVDRLLRDLRERDHMLKTAAGIIPRDLFKEITGVSQQLLDVTRSGTVSATMLRDMDERKRVNDLVRDLAEGGATGRATDVARRLAEGFPYGGVSRARERAMPSLPLPTATSKPIAAAAELGKLVRSARKAMKFNQSQFAAHAGVGRRFLSELESGKPSLEFDKVLACAAAAGIDLFARPRRN